VRRLVGEFVELQHVEAARLRFDPQRIGFGTRFFPATKAIPKEMFPIVDTPLIQYIVEEAINSGIEDIVLVTSRYKEAIENHFDLNPELEAFLEKRQQKEFLKISKKLGSFCRLLTVRQKEPLGLGHAVLCAASIIGNEPFAVLLGDDLIDAAIPCTRQLIDLFYKEKISIVAIMEVSQEQKQRYGIVNGPKIKPNLMKVEQFIEKPEPGEIDSCYAVPGRYVLDPIIFDYLKETPPGRGGEIQLTDALRVLVREPSRRQGRLDERDLEFW
jgi:UTP--glucose-1-phosphate uridylyltransferase